MKSTFLSLPKPLFPLLPSTTHRRHLRPSKSTNNNTNEIENTTLPITPPPETVNIKFRRGSRRRKQRQLEDDALSPKKKDEAPPKDWESMSLTEKAIELYVGEKGLLFWLNKFAYASIYIIIGAWILFRFVGPALDLYQLDSAPLSPSSLLKG